MAQKIPLTKSQYCCDLFTHVVLQFVHAACICLDFILVRWIAYVLCDCFECLMALTLNWKSFWDNMKRTKNIRIGRCALSKMYYQILTCTMYYWNQCMTTRKDLNLWDSCVILVLQFFIFFFILMLIWTLLLNNDQGCRLKPEGEENTWLSGQLYQLKSYCSVSTCPPIKLALNFFPRQILATSLITVTLRFMLYSGRLSLVSTQKLSKTWPFCPVNSHINLFNNSVLSKFIKECI